MQYLLCTPSQVKYLKLSLLKKYNGKNNFHLEKFYVHWRQQI